MHFPLCRSSSPLLPRLLSPPIPSDPRNSSSTRRALRPIRDYVLRAADDSRRPLDRTDDDVPTYTRARAVLQNRPRRWLAFSSGARFALDGRVIVVRRADVRGGTCDVLYGRTKRTIDRDTHGNGSTCP